jgi:predicted CoA-substrate-specific enzyme activase
MWSPPEPEVYKINERGKLKDWATHDKCAAGTGVFVKQMAKLMQISMEEMSRLSLDAKTRPEISGTCAVFAESEVISHVHRDPPTPMADIAAGIYYSIVSRLMALCKRVGIEKDVVVTGGVALNKGLINILEQELRFKVLVPDAAQSVAALGAAIIAQEQIERDT